MQNFLRFIVSKKKLFLLLCAVATANAVLCQQSEATDTIYGQVVKDPFRWLENEGSDSVTHWFQNQQNITKQFKAKFNSTYIKAYNDILTRSSYYIPAVQVTSPYYLYFGQSENPFDYATVIYYSKSLSDRPVLAFDAAQFFPKQEVNIVSTRASDDARYLSVAMSVNEATQLEIRIRDVYADNYVNDKIRDVKSGNMVWWKDGFFYTRVKEKKNKSSQEQLLMYYHRIGQYQADDQLVLSVPDSGNAVFAYKRTCDKKYLIISTAAKINGRWCHVVEYKNLDEGLFSPAQPIVAATLNESLIFNVLDLVDSNFIILTNYDAPHFKMMKYKMGELNKGTELVRQFADVLIEALNVNHQLLGIYFDKGLYKAAVFDYSGNQLYNIHFDKNITVSNFTGSPNDSVVTYLAKSFTFPGVLRTLNLNSRHIEQPNQTQIHYESEDYTSSIVTYTSKDGIEIPMYLVYKKGLNLKGNNPLLLYSFSSTNGMVTPFYSYRNIMFCASNGIVAVPLLRGCQGMGTEWKRAGSLLHEQNAIDDLTAAAEFLQKEGYTSKERLAIEGGTLGGSMLAAAAITQKPDLCKTFLGISGIYDMMRWPQLSSAPFLSTEFGDPGNRQNFENMLSYSPIHHLATGVSYPSALFMSETGRDYGLASQTYKFLASLQQASVGNNPHFLYFNENITPPGTLPFHKTAREEAYKISFLLYSLGYPLLLGN